MSGERSEEAAPAELIFFWILLTYKEFAPSGAKDQSTLSKKCDAL
jgi:hypothetical protein